MKKVKRLNFSYGDLSISTEYKPLPSDSGDPLDIVCACGHSAWVCVVDIISYGFCGESSVISVLECAECGHMLHTMYTVESEVDLFALLK